MYFTLHFFTLPGGENNMTEEHGRREHREGGPGAAQAVFYNMTGEDLQIQVNDQMSTQETIAAIPATSPYTPNHNVNPYTRIALSQPQVNQFGSHNTLLYESMGGLSLKMQVTIDVEIKDYPVTVPLLIFLFRTAVVATCPSDSVPYVGHNNDVVNVSSSVQSATL
ncbi:MAG: hypothetical protein ACRDOB_04760 [Streptosporangiaceae bacterium]